MRTSRSEDEFSRELAHLIKAEGISRLSVAEIAQRLRCSRRRLYKLATTKEGLLVAVAEAMFAEALQNGDSAAAAQDSAPERVLAFLRAGSEMAATVREPFLEDVNELPVARAAFDRYQIARAAGLRALIEEGVRNGEFAPCNGQLIAEVALGAALRLRRPQFLHAVGMTVQQAFDEAFGLIVNGMLKPTSGSRPPARAAQRRTSLEVPL